MTLSPSGLWLHRYRPGGLLGRGTHGTVFCATDTLAGDDVAVKVLHLAHLERARQFRREITALRALRIPGVVELRDEGVEDDQQLVVMDRLDGAPFPGVEASLPWAALREPVLDLLDTLDLVHGTGIVHRDLKPSNVFVDSAGRTTVLDFGLASGKGVGDGRITLEGGTPRYAAPEQLLDEPVTPSTDLFALAVMIWEALTGALPHPDDGIVSRLFAEPLPLDLDLPDRVEDVLRAMLAREPDARPPSAAEVASQLRGDWIAPLPPLPEVVSVDGLQPLFLGPERLLHVPQRAAAQLHRRTRGERERVAIELTRWCHSGAVRLRDDRFEVLPGGLRRVGLLPDPPDQAPERASGPLDPARLARVLLSEGPPPEAELVAVIRRARDEGRIGEALGLLEAFAPSVTSPEGRHELMIVWIDVAMTIGTSSALERVLVQLERIPDDPWVEAAFAVVRAGLLGMRGEARRALEQLAAVELPPDCVTFARAIQVRAASIGHLDDGTLRDALLSDASSDDPGSWRARMWLGLLDYRAGRTDEAARWHRAALSRAPTAAARLAAGINAASAALDSGDLDGALLLAAQVFEQARAIGFSEYEARAEVEIRSCAYTMDRTGTPDLELVEALSHLDLPDLLGRGALTEAAVAWRAGDLELSGRLAAISQRAYATIESGSGLLLARALHAAVDGAHTPVDAARRAELLTLIDECELPLVRAQALGLVRLAAPPSERPGLVARVEAIVNALRAAPDLDRRREVVSLAEALGRGGISR